MSSDIATFDNILYMYFLIKFLTDFKQNSNKLWTKMSHTK